MKGHLPLPASLFAALLSLPVHAIETTPLQTIQVGSDSNGIYTDLDGNEVQVATDQALSGFTKFDPGLGTLVEVLFTVEVNASVDVELCTSELDDPGQPFSVYLDPGGAALLQVGIVYSPTGEAFGKVVTLDSGGLNSVGVQDGDPDDYTFEEMFYFQASTTTEYGGFSNGGDTATEGSLPASDPDLKPADFIGTGNVVGLSFFHIAIIPTSQPQYSTVSNVFNAYVDLSVAHQGGNVTLQYVYEPSATTAPTLITSYQKSGTTHTFHFTGEASRTNWVIKGGAALPSLTVDHTAAATINEPSPGIYEATVPLPSVLDPGYFFRIE
jgi:hypothetical protein